MLAEEVDSLLETAKHDRRIFMNRKETYAIRNDDTTKDSTIKQIELDAAKLELAGSIAMIAALPDGPKKVNEITNKLALELKIRRLSLGELNPVNLVKAAYDVEMLDKQIALLDSFITDLEKRRSELI